jgi:hypothetical protein
MTTTTEPSEAQHVFGRLLVEAQARAAAETPSTEAVEMTSPLTRPAPPSAASVPAAAAGEDKDGVGNKTDGAGEDEDGAGEDEDVDGPDPVADEDDGAGHGPAAAAFRGEGEDDSDDRAVEDGSSIGLAAPVQGATRRTGTKTTTAPPAVAPWQASLASPTAGAASTRRTTRRHRKVLHELCAHLLTLIVLCVHW